MGREEDAPSGGGSEGRGRARLTDEARAAELRRHELHRELQDRAQAMAAQVRADRLARLDEEGGPPWEEPAS